MWSLYSTVILTILSIFPGWAGAQYMCLAAPIFTTAGLQTCQGGYRPCGSYGGVWDGSGLNLLVSISSGGGPCCPTNAYCAQNGQGAQVTSCCQVGGPCGGNVATQTNQVYITTVYQNGAPVAGGVVAPVTVNQIPPTTTVYAVAATTNVPKRTQSLVEVCATGVCTVYATSDAPKSMVDFRFSAAALAIVAAIFISL